MITNELLRAAKVAADQLMAIGVSEESHDIAVNLRAAIAAAEQAQPSEPAPSDTDTRMFPELRDLCGELEDRSVGADTIGIMYVRQRLEHAVGEAERKAARMLRGGAS